jgi:putative transposase
VAKMCNTVGVSKSGYYDWVNRKSSARKKFNLLLLFIIKEIHSESDEIYGSVRIHREVLNILK